MKFATRGTFTRSTRRSLGIWLIGGSFVVAALLAATFATAALRHIARAGQRREVGALGAAIAAQTSWYVHVIELGLDRVQSHVLETQATTHAAFDAMAASRETFALLRRTARYLPQADALFILDRSGKLVNFTRSYPPPVVHAADRDFFRTLRTRGGSAVVFATPLRTRGTDVPGIVVARRLSAPDGGFLGIAGAVISIRRLRAFYASVVGVEGQTTSLLRRDGVPLVTWPRPPAPSAAVPGAAPWYAAVAAGGGTYREPGRLVSVHPLPHDPLVVDVGLTDQQALAQARAQARVIWLAALVVAAAIGLLFVVVVRQFEKLEVRNVELSRSADKLRWSERRFLDFARTASDWFWELDATLRVIVAGPESVPPGARDGAPIGQHPWDIVDVDRDSDGWIRLQAVLARRQPFRDFRYARADRQGVIRQFSTSGIPVHDEAGAFAGYRGTVRDISPQHAAEAGLRSAKERAERAEALLDDAVDAISEGFVIYDRDDRLVMCNQGYFRIHPSSRARMVPGTKFETLLRDGLARGEYTDALGREEEWLERRLRQHRAAAGAIEQALTDGRTMLITERRMRNGGIAGLRIDITELKQAQAALRASEERLDRAQQIAQLGSWELAIATGRYVWSKEMYRIRGVSAATFTPTAETLASHTEDPGVIRDWLTRLAVERGAGTLEYSIVLPDGRKRLIRNEGRALVDPDGVVRRLSGTVQDITDQRRIEQQLVQAQKMEAVGNLTGGISHDFNNLLGVIIGNLQLLEEQIGDDPEASELCGEALAAGRRGADLTRRLLAFARRQPLVPKATDINALIDDAVTLLRRVLRANIAITLDLAPDLRPIVVDPVQLEAALTNLATNAADAMPRGGRLTITTAPAVLDSDYAAEHAEVMPGCYTSITVSDTGTGMPPEVKAQIFEPFFTTKPPGQGTGLGLSMVFGFIKQSGGHVAVYSEPGQGTTFRLYLRAHPASSPEPLPAPAQAVRGGTETVLLAEDDPLMRRSLVRQITGLGYVLIEAASAAEALAILGSGTEIDLLLSDVIMPGLANGLDLADQVSRAYPGVRVLLMSGFPEARSTTYTGSASGFRLISKPFDRDQLAVAIRALLDAPRAPEVPATSAADGDV